MIMMMLHTQIKKNKTKKICWCGRESHHQSLCLTVTVAFALLSFGKGWTISAGQGVLDVFGLLKERLSPPCQKITALKSAAVHNYTFTKSYMHVLILFWWICTTDVKKTRRLNQTDVVFLSCYMGSVVLRDKLRSSNLCAYVQRERFKATLTENRASRAMQLHPFRLGRVTAPVLPASMSCCVLPISIAHDCIKILSMLGVIIGSFEPA